MDRWKGSLVWRYYDEPEIVHREMSPGGPVEPRVETE